MKKHFKKFVLVFAVTLAGAMVSAWDWTSYCENMDGSQWLIKAGVGYGWSSAKVDGGSYTAEWTVGGHKYTYPVDIGKFKSVAAGFVIPIQGEYLLSAIPLGITAQFRPLFGKYSGFSTSGFAIMAGANYHVAPGPAWLDLYAGMEMGLFYHSVKYEESYWYGGDGYYNYETKAKGAGFAFDAHIGASLMFSNMLGVNVEVGYPTVFSTSVVLKI
ncbi:MAG: hypothetical protein HDR36_01755 [Treponema sp.]|nr:hypothetical protein [Treponema sp.]